MLFDAKKIMKLSYNLLYSTIEVKFYTSILNTLNKINISAPVNFIEILRPHPIICGNPIIMKF